MARLKPHRRERAASALDAPPIHLTDWRTPTPVDDRPRTVTPVNLYTRVSDTVGRLAYKAGDLVPDDELPHLLPEPEFQRARRAGRRLPDTPATRGRTHR